jgi:glycosyltransferase involved in cell wall biosynthesis
VRIAQVCARAYPLLGGIETHVEEVSLRLAARGHDVTIVTTDPSRTLPRRDVHDGVRVRRHRAWPRDRDWYLSPGLFLDVLRGRYDLVHVQGVHTLSAPFAMVAAVLSHTPFVLTFHTGGHSSPTRESFRERQWQLLAPLLRRAGRLIAVCRHEVAIFTPVIDRGPGRFLVVRNGAELPRPAGEDVELPASAGPVVSSVGRLERYKGHQRLIAALPALRVRYPNAVAVIVGSGPYGDELRGQARALGVEEHVLFRHFPATSRGRLADLLLASDVVVLLSDYEAHPVSVMEAIGLGRPVLVARTSGLTELADDGLVHGVPAEAPAATVAEAIAGAIGAPTPDVHVQTWDETVDELEMVYGDVLAERR